MSEVLKSTSSPTFAAGLWQGKEDTNLLVFAGLTVAGKDGEMVVFESALHPVEKSVAPREEFEEKFVKLHKPIFSEEAQH